MSKKLTINLIAFSLLIFTAIQASAQSSSVAVFSPYTMYGLGDMQPGGSASQRLMGGVGIAFRNAYEFNYANPASLSAIRPNSAVFNFGAQGQNYYSKTARASTSHSNFDFHDIGLALPLMRGLAIGFSMQPVTSVGYKTAIIDDDPNIIENIGRAVYDYNGEGGISQLNFGAGVQVLPGLSLGANMIYYFGVINRNYNASIFPMINDAAYSTINSYQELHISKLLYSVGAQYSLRVAKESILMFGATYQPSAKLSSRQVLEQVATTGSSIVDTISFSQTRSAMTLPSKLGVGLFFASEHFTAGADYTNQNWKGSFEIPTDQGITLRAQEEYKFGASYTPNRTSVRSVMARWTYKVGFRYGTSYLMKDDFKLTERAFTFGADIPMMFRKAPSMSKFSLGFEVGTRGAVRAGQVRENYVKVFAAFSLFGNDYWFVRPKYN